MMRGNAFVHSLCALFLLTAAAASAKPQSFLPPNNLHLYDNPKAPTGITEEQFNEIIDHATNLYAEVVEAHGAVLKINGDWADSTVNAYALQRTENGQLTYLVKMFGGLARRDEITPDGFALVVCHELGHHLGGFPFRFSWAAAEGQSDYFATQACARRVWADQKEQNAAARESINDVAKAMCDEVWQDEAAQNLCYRTMLGGKSLADLLAALGSTGPIEFDTPDETEVSQTKLLHPKAQCRLDTYVAGALCTADFGTDVIPQNEEDSANYLCTRARQYTHGNRPLCWYKPSLEG